MSTQRGVSASSSSRSIVATLDNEIQASPSASLGLVSSREPSHESVKPASTSPNRTPTSSAMGTAIPPSATAISGDQSSGPWLPSNPADEVVNTDSVLHISFLFSIVRSPGQGRQYVVKTALISNVTVCTHPDLVLRRGFCLSIPASPANRQESLVINLPASHNFVSLRLQVVGSIPQRQTKLVALIGTQNIHVAPQPNSSATEPVYDVLLTPGVTKVDFQMIAVHSRNTSSCGPFEVEKEYERLTLFFNLLW